MACWMRRRQRSRASPARRTTWKGSMTAVASGSSSVVAVLNPVKPVHRDDLDRVPPRGGAGGQPLLERLLGASFHHVQQPGRSGTGADRGQVDDDRDVLVAAAG